jgi:ADP-dependent NAD(P)H-hydrate dehydratase / NAD(P)H-hydrate epimerase
MIPVLSREQMRELDRHAIEQAHVPSLVLMENAGRGAATVISRELGDGPGRVVVLAGGGNNGGDGFVVARRLMADGREVEIFLIADAGKLKGDALENHDAWKGLGQPVHAVTDDASFAPLVGRLGELVASDAVVDALFGTGLDRNVEGRFASVIEAINESDARCFALDVPSGLDANTGAVLGIAVRAEATITFQNLKLGLVTNLGADHAGDVHVVDIGVPADLCQRVGMSALAIERADVRDLVTPRAVSTHKGSAGHVLAVAGSTGKTGAALLVARGALRGGAGVATICTFADAAGTLDHRVLEEMTARIDPARVEASLDEALALADVVAIGPGLGLGAEARRVVDHVVLGWGGPTVVDADALTHFADRIEALQKAAGPRLLTPHPGELGRLLGCSAADVERDRFGSLARAVERSGCVVLLKGARTLIGAPGELPLVNVSGTPALATAGSGDVLTGLCAAFASSLALRFAAMVAAHVHALSAERWSERTGADRGLLAHEIADGVPEVLGALAAPLSSAAGRMPV